MFHTGACSSGRVDGSSCIGTGGQGVLTATAGMHNRQVATVRT